MDRMLRFLRVVTGKLPRIKRTWHYKASFAKKHFDKSGLAKVLVYNVEGNFVRVGRKGDALALEAARLHIAYQYHIKPRNLIISSFKLTKKQEVHNEPKSPSSRLLLPNRHKQHQGPTHY